MVYKISIFLAACVVFQARAIDEQSRPATFGLIDSHGEFRVRTLNEQGKVGYKVTQVSADGAEFLEHQYKECTQCGGNVAVFLNTAGEIIGTVCMQGSAKELEAKALAMIASGELQNTDLVSYTPHTRKVHRVLGIHLPEKYKADEKNLEFEAYQSQLNEMEPENVVLRVLGVKLRKNTVPSRPVAQWIVDHTVRLCDCNVK